jgi:hypothetical protein
MDHATTVFEGDGANDILLNLALGFAVFACIILNEFGMH